MNHLFREIHRNPLLSVLSFSPTTILGMTWGGRFLRKARGREFDAAVTLAAMIFPGWMTDCLLLGFISDRLGRHKPMIFGGTNMLLAVVSPTCGANSTIPFVLIASFRSFGVFTASTIAELP
jgi:MFS family permease